MKIPTWFTVYSLLSTILIGCAHNPVHPSWRGKVSPVKEQLMQLAKSTEAPVSVAIYGEARILYTDKQYASSGFSSEAMKQAMVSKQQTVLEQSYLSHMRGVKNFHIVDRMALNKVMEELKFTLSGALSQAVRVRIGEMTGASHLILFDETLYPNNERTTTVRLLALESGEVLASQSVEVQP
jgi:hypothetical protein